MRRSPTGITPSSHRRPSSGGAIAQELPLAGAGALFCVEADPEACHRSIIAERLARQHPLAVTHLRPQR